MRVAEPKNLLVQIFVASEISRAKRRTFVLQNMPTMYKVQIPRPTYGCAPTPDVYLFIWLGGQSVELGLGLGLGVSE